MVTPRTGRPTGRPKRYNAALAASLCDHLANGGSLRAWCDIPGNPAFSTVYDWMDSEPGFADAYARARERQAHNDGDRVNQIVEQIARGELAPEQGRVMMDGLKWAAGKRLPRLYGDRAGLLGDGQTGPLVVTWLQAPAPGSDIIDQKSTVAPNHLITHSK